MILPKFCCAMASPLSLSFELLPQIKVGPIPLFLGSVCRLSEVRSSDLGSVPTSLRQVPLSDKCLISGSVFCLAIRAERLSASSRIGIFRFYIRMAIYLVLSF